MKLATFRNVFALSMMIFLIASCGKDKKKKNNCDGINMYSNPACYGVNPYGLNGQYQPGGQIAYNTQAKAQLDQWMNSPNESGPLPYDKNLIDINFGNFQVGASSDYCYILQGGNYHMGNYNKVSGTNYCDNMQVYSKGVNPRLVKALNGDNGMYTLLDVRVQGQTYILSYGYGVTGIPQYQQQVAKVYVINTAVHSMINPVEVYEANNPYPVESFRSFQKDSDMVIY